MNLVSVSRTPTLLPCPNAIFLFLSVPFLPLPFSNQSCEARHFTDEDSKAQQGEGLAGGNSKPAPFLVLQTSTQLFKVSHLISVWTPSQNKRLVLRDCVRGLQEDPQIQRFAGGLRTHGYTHGYDSYQH